MTPTTHTHAEQWSYCICSLQCLLQHNLNTRQTLTVTRHHETDTLRSFDDYRGGTFGVSLSTSHTTRDGITSCKVVFNRSYDGAECQCSQAVRSATGATGSSGCFHFRLRWSYLESTYVVCIFISCFAESDLILGALDLLSNAAFCHIATHTYSRDG